MATAPLGLESVVAREVRNLGYETTEVDNGRVVFTADASGIARANLWLRAADRVLLVVGRFEATTFETLFEATRALPWDELLPRDARFPVEGRSVKSQLSSVPACQSIVKKAIVSALQDHYGDEWLSESGDEYTVEVSLLKDQVTLTLDTSGAGLHKRGYRTLTGPAPIKETLAAALVLLSRWEPHRPFADPLCGTGTIAIEAAMIGARMAPGFHRSFASEHFPWVGQARFERAREEALDLVRKNHDLQVFASDIDSVSVENTGIHARQAGVGHIVHTERMPLRDFAPDALYGCIVTNPPYGERIGEKDEVRSLHRDLGQFMKKHSTWSVFAISAHEQFEREVGKRADRNRKLYNGRIECHLYQYLGPLPKREHATVPSETV